MSAFAHAWALYLHRFPALVGAAAIALLPANVVMTGATVYLLAEIGPPGPPGPPVAGGDNPRPPDIARDAAAQPSVSPVPFPLWRSVLLALTATTCFALGVSIAVALLTPMVLDGAQPGAAFRVVGARLGPLLWTAVLGAVLIALGLVLLVVPGLVAMLGFAFAQQIAVRDGPSGGAALERSWELTRGSRGRVLLLAVLVAAIALLGAALGQTFAQPMLHLWVPALVRTVLLPLPLIALVMLYAEAAGHQYMRRISVPG